MRINTPAGFAKKSMAPLTPFEFGQKIAAVSRFYNDAPSVNIQNFAPQLRKREFSREELADIEAGKDRWLPDILQNYGTPVTNMLASPLKTGLISAVPGALGGAVIGGGLGQNSGLGSLLGALAGAGITGTAGYLYRQNKNDGLIDMLGRLPEQATQRDLLSDPAYQADLDRKLALTRLAQMRAARAAAAIDPDSKFA